MLKDKSLTYVSLFSCAGVGCYGFHMEGYHCIATNEIVERRLAVQKYNDKCELSSGYIAGDITKEETKALIYDEIDKWKKKGNDRVDVVIATPPCQGISVINHKKNEHDINRNSLVVESVEIVKTIHPRIFIFENVQAFQKTFCITKDDKTVRIGDFIRDVLGKDYIITGKVINFMNYGSNSSRTRTLVIGVDKEYRNTLTPYDLFPTFRKEKTLRDVIGDGQFSPLEWGEIQAEDFYHAFRIYDSDMRSWIHDLKEGESAFDNKDPLKRPHRVVDGCLVENIQKNRDKYTRQKWDRFIQCIHTRNDQLAAQNTIHPVEDRVFSIREIMKMMTIPFDFKWVDFSLDELNAMSDVEKRRIYKENEVNIRQCLGEAVPTEIMRQIAVRIKEEFCKKRITPADINRIIENYRLEDKATMNCFVNENPEQLSLAELQRVVELCNAKREENAAYYTNKFIVNEIMDILPDFGKDEIWILEPSVGAGGFLPFIFKRYGDVPRVHLDIIDIDEDSIATLRLLISRMDVPCNFSISILNEDFLQYDPIHKYDLAVGNPPYSKLSNPSPELLFRLTQNVNTDTKNLSEMFLEKCLMIADFTALVLNKTILSTGEFDKTRELLRKMRIESIIDFGRYGFTGLSIETICLAISPKQKPAETYIHNMKYNFRIHQCQDYITDSRYPYFVIYRDSEFDSVAEKLQFDMFTVFRDRQITKQNTTLDRHEGYLRVIKARNIQDNGSIVDIDGYDTYIDPVVCSRLSVYQFVGNLNVYLTPNMTYNPRIIPNVGEIVPDGSVAILIPKSPIVLTKEQMDYLASEEYRRFYLVARNLSTQSINVDNKSVFFYGVLKHDN